MIKSHKWKLLLSSLLILAPMLVGFFYWNELPEQMATHWGANGKVDEWSGRTFAVVGMPLICLVIHWICAFVTEKDPKNAGQNRKLQGLVLWICPIISLFANGTIYAASLEKNLNISSMVLLLCGLMFLVIGNYMPKCRQNYTMGIKIKWTLISEENWNVTHRFAGKVWVIGGLFLMVLALLPVKKSFWLWGILLPTMSIAVIPMVYSYLFYKKQVREGTVSENATLELGKWYKMSGILICIVITLVLCMLSFFAFSAGFEIEYGDTAFTVDAKGWNNLTVEYQAVDAVEYRDTAVDGVRTYGFGPIPVLMGMFENSEFGSYTRYTYAKCDASVILTVDGKILVIGGKDTESTQMIYNELKTRIS
ncbi:MAG: SdpI family protein [Oscillospiraceae bacterium]|nr:SdpI family protein [Oscillospiraceae bacterium]